jgi:hypothetical protein
MRLCVWWTKQRVKAARLGNAVAMMHDLRILNARGHQEWNGHDRYDEAHPTLPVWRDSRPDHNTIRVHPYPLRSFMCLLLLARTGLVLFARTLGEFFS